MTVGSAVGETIKVLELIVTSESVDLSLRSRALRSIETLLSCKVAFSSVEHLEVTLHG